MGSQIIKTEKLGSLKGNPFSELERIVVFNDGKNPEIWRDYQGKRIVILPGKSETFIRTIRKKLGNKIIRLIQKPKFDVEEV